MREFNEVLKEHQALQGIAYSETEKIVAKVFYHYGAIEALKDEIEGMEKRLSK